MPDLKKSVPQPIPTIGLGNGWSTGLSEMPITCDLDRNDWVSLPLGVKLAKLLKFGAVPMQFTAQYEYSSADDYAVPEDPCSFAVRLLMPTGGWASTLV